MPRISSITSQLLLGVGQNRLYFITPNITSVNEGSSVTFTINTLNVPDGTVLYWTTKPIDGNIVSSDFTDGNLSGSFTINNGTATIIRTLTADLLEEGQESFALEIRTDSTSGTVRATSETIIVNDTSVPTYSIVPNITSVNEGGSVTFTVTTTGVANGTTLFWNTQAVTGLITAGDFTDNAVSGTVTINNGTGTIVRGIRADNITEGTESFRLQLRTGSTSGVLRATSADVTINDTSMTPSYAVTPSVTSVNEGGSVTFTVTTTNVPNGTTLFWTTDPISGTININDFTDLTLSGSFTINNNTASIVRGIRADFNTEGTESFRLRIHTDSTAGTVRATSSIVTINDTSLTDPNAVTGQVLFSGSTSVNGTTDNTWTVPAGVRSISFVLIGAGGGSAGFSDNEGMGSGGGGGGLLYRNDFPVTPGTQLTISVGNSVATGQRFRGQPAPNPTRILDSNGTVLFSAAAGGHGDFTQVGQSFVFLSGGLGGSQFTHDGFAVTNRGGDAGGAEGNVNSKVQGGGGGAGGYSGVGGRGGGYFPPAFQTFRQNATAGQGGAGGGGGSKTNGGLFDASRTTNTSNFSGRGGPVSPFGNQGTNGAAGASVTALNSSSSAGWGGAGSFAFGESGAFINNNRFGGGAAGHRNPTGVNFAQDRSDPGAARIIWPGNVRQFPSTRTVDE